MSCTTLWGVSSVTGISVIIQRVISSKWVLKNCSACKSDTSAWNLLTKRKNWHFQLLKEADMLFGGVKSTDADDLFYREKTFSLFNKKMLYYCFCDVVMQCNLDNALEAHNWFDAKFCEGNFLTLTGAQPSCFATLAECEDSVQM